MALSKQQKITLAVVAPLLWLLVGFWLAGYFYLWKIAGAGATMQARPWTIFQYWTHYGHVPGVRAWLVGLTIFSLILAALPAVAVIIPKKRKLHGDAKLATKRELEQAGLFKGGNTWILMHHSGRFLYSLADKICSFILAAPPRSGKGTGNVQPNMFHLGCSVIITDIRQESFGITSGFRSKFSEIYLFNPFPSKARRDGKIVVDENGNEVWEARTHRYNPFFYVPDDPAIRINELQKIATFLFPDPLKGDPFWSSSARSLFLGLSLYVFETEGLPKTLGEVYRQISSCGDGGEAISEYWSKIIADREASSSPLSASCVAALKDFIATGGNTLTSIRKTLTSSLEILANPVVDAMTSGNDFDLRDLRKKVMTIYIGVTPDNLERARPLLSLFVQQALDLNMQEMPHENPAIKHPAYFLLDEVTALGRIPAFVTSAGYVNGYWLAFGYIIQGFSQLRDVYGQEGAQTILTCCQIRLAFAPKSHQDAEELSKEFGNITEKTESTSRGRGLGSKNQGSVSSSVAQRALFLPQEIRNMGQDKIMAFIENVPPIIGQKIVYYKEDIFKKRVLPAVEVEPLDYMAFIQKQTPTPAASPFGTLDSLSESGGPAAVPEAPASLPFQDIFNTPSPSPAIVEEAVPSSPVNDNDNGLFSNEVGEGRKARLLDILDAETEATQADAFAVGLADFLNAPPPDDLGDLIDENVLRGIEDNSLVILNDMSLDSFADVEISQGEISEAAIRTQVDKFFEELEGSHAA